MHHPARDYEELARAQGDVRTPLQPDLELPGENEEDLVHVGMLVRDELPGDLDQLHLPAVGLGDHLRRPVPGEECELVLGVDDDVRSRHGRSLLRYGRS
jgi:hypothetical protein